MNVCSGFNNYMYEQFFRKQVTGVLFQNSRLTTLQKQRKTPECDTEGVEREAGNGGGTCVTGKVRESILTFFFLSAAD